MKFPFLLARCVVVLAVLASGSAILAVDAFKPGDDVEVLNFDEWVRGKVVGTSRLGIVVEYPFGASMTRRSFRPGEIREALEPGTLSKERTWTDATGKFRIKAVLLLIEEDKITLRKPDKSEVTLEIAKLSAADRTIIKNIAKSQAAPQPMGGAPGFPPSPPGFPGSEKGPDLGPAPAAQAVESFARDSAIAAGGESIAKPVALTPDPLPTYLKLQEGGAAISDADFFSEVSTLLPVGGKDVWLLAAIGSKHAQSEAPTRLAWCSLARKKIEKQQVLPGGEEVLDYHAPSHRLLTYSTDQPAGAIGPRGAPTLSLWEVLPTDKEVKAVARWSIAGGPDDRPSFDPSWARLITGDLVLSRLGDSDLALWDVAKKSLRYRLSQEAFHPADPTLSPGRKHLFVPERTSVRIYEAETGKLVSVLPTEREAIAVGISDNGRQAVVREVNQLGVWDLALAETKPRYFPTPVSRRERVHFLSDDRVLLMDTGHMMLYSLKHSMPLWSYQLLAAEHGNNASPVLAPHLAYSVKLGGARGGLAVGAVKLPGPGVEEAAAKANREAALVVKPGTAVKLEVTTGEFDPQVKAALEKKIAANGWKLAPDAAVVITAEIKRGEQQSVTYRGSGFNGPKTTVSLTPYLTSLVVKAGQDVAWSSGSETGAPHFIRLDEGQTIQGEVDKQQKPNPGFFEKVELPREILDPTKAHGYGVTQITDRGLEAKGLPDGPRRQ